MGAKNRKFVPSIQSEGDLEIVLLHETHSASATIIGPWLYTISGSPPEQTAQFNDTPHFDLFLILLVEFFAEGARSALIEDKFQNLSLLRALKWFCKKYPDESRLSDLDKAVDALSGWVSRCETIRFWCPSVDTSLELNITNEQIISFGANATKHHLLRLTELLNKTDLLCTSAGYNFSPQELVAVLTDMTEHVRSRLMYHSTFLLELLGNVLLALNNVIVRHFKKNPTNDTRKMTFPAGVTSDIFRDLYGSVLVFKRYEEDRITAHTPVTTRHLKGPYRY